MTVHQYHPRAADHAGWQIRGLHGEPGIAIPQNRSLARSRVDKDDDEDGAGARRYAQLLVSEIKLYHEDSIAAGRRDRDLGNRLGGEIARARVLYEQRVPPHVRARAPYFDDELVRTLADGDASLLGART